MNVKLYDYCKNRRPDCFCHIDNTKTIAIDNNELSELLAKAAVYDNAKEDLELAQAVRWAQTQDMYMTDDEMWSCDLEQLVLMYRDLKGE